MQNDTHQWVAIYTNPRAEKKAAERLQELGYESYLPLLHKQHRWSDRWKIVEVPMIPSYIFAKICTRDVVPVRAADGVSYIVSWRGKPAIISNKEIEAMRRIADADAEVYIRNNELLKKGAHVKITGGQFAGLEGDLVSNCEEGNFCISITGLDFCMVMQVEGALLQPIETKKEEKGIWD
jgi:transcription antitermination factor NusG